MDQLVATLANAVSSNMNLVQLAEQQLKQHEATPGYYSALMDVFSNKGVPEDVRWAAIVTVKNGIDKYWRKSALNALSEEEKAYIRQRLEQGHDERSNKIAIQLSVLISRIARYDVPEKWPELFPLLMQCLQSQTVLVQQRAIRTLYMVIKTLARKRIPAAGRQLSEVAPVLFLHLRSFWMFHLETFFRLQANHEDLASQEQLSVSTIFCLYSIKCLRYLYVFTFKESSSDSQESNEFLSLSLQALQSFIGSYISYSGLVPVETLSKIILQFGKLFSDMESNKGTIFFTHPVCPAILDFCDQQLRNSAQNPKMISDLGRFLIQCIIILQSAAKSLLDIQTLAKDGLNPNQFEIKQMLTQFWSPARQTSLFELLVMGYLPLTTEEIEQMQFEPEEFSIIEDTDLYFTSLRLATEAIISLLIDRFKDVTAPVFVRLLEQAVVQPVDGPMPSLILKESVYNVLTLGAFHLYDFVNIEDLLATYLIPEAAHSNQLISIILRRRLALVIEAWISVKISAEKRPDLYRVLVSLLGPTQALIVRLATAKSMRKVLDDFDFELPSFLPFMNEAFLSLTQLLYEAKENDSRVVILECLSVITARCGSSVRSLLSNVLATLPALWNSSTEQSLLRQQVIQLALRMVEAFGVHSVELYPFVLPIIEFCCGSNQLLLEDGLELWLGVVSNSPPLAAPQLWNLFPRACAILSDTDTATFKNSADLILAYLLLQPSLEHLMLGADKIRETMFKVMDIPPDYRKSQAVGVVAKLLDVFLLVHTDVAVVIMQPLLPNIAEVLMKADVTEPILVHFAYLSLLSRLLLQQHQPALAFLLSVGESGLAKILDNWTDKLTAFGQPTQMKLNAMAISTLLSCQNVVIQRRIEDIVNVILNVVYNTTSQDSATGTSHDSLMYNEDDEYDTYSASEGEPNINRRRELLKHDPVYNTDIRQFIKQQVTVMQHVYGPDEAGRLLGSIDVDLQRALHKVLTEE